MEANRQLRHTRHLRLHRFICGGNLRHAVTSPRAASTIASHPLTNPLLCGSMQPMQVSGVLDSGLSWILRSLSASSRGTITRTSGRAKPCETTRARRARSPCPSPRGGSPSRHRFLVRAKVVPRPAVETAFLDVRDVVWHQVVAQRIALILRGSELAGLRTRGQTDRVRMPEAKMRSFLPSASKARIGPASFVLIVVDVRARADRDNRDSCRREKTPGPASSVQRHRRAGCRRGPHFIQIRV
jgi:hypothetical protein